MLPKTNHTSFDLPLFANSLHHLKSLCFEVSFRRTQKLFWWWSPEAEEAVSHLDKIRRETSEGPARRAFLGPYPCPWLRRLCCPEDRPTHNLRALCVIAVTWIEEFPAHVVQATSMTLSPPLSSFLLFTVTALKSLRNLNSNLILQVVRSRSRSEDWNACGAVC